MKKSVEIIGLPVISINEGKELGSVQKVVINPTEGSIAALIIDDGKWYLGAKLLPFTAITGLGESAITIEDSTTIVTVATAPELEKLLCADITVIGTKVLTKVGRIQGKVNEIIVDNTGKIVSCEIEELSGEITDIPAQRIVTFGREVLIINDETETTNPVVTEAKKVVTANPAITTTTPSPENHQNITSTSEKATNNSVKENHNDDSAKKFDEKQRKYLLGKQASRRIETDNGMLIVEQGGEINDEVLQKAKLAGKFVELSMNIQ